MDANDSLNIIEQQLMTIYTQICLCYPMSDDVSQESVIATLQKGLERLAESFPWLAGQVVNEGAGEGNTGTYRIIPLEPVPRLTVKDLRNNASAPTWSALEKAEFPFRLLDENIIAPRNTIPGTGQEKPSSDPGMPVFLVQANFLQGGLVLTINGQHQSMDMTGQGVVIELFSKACRNEPFTPEDLATGNAARANMTPLLDESWQPDGEVDMQTVKPAPATPNETSESPPPSTWAYFLFSPSSLESLKDIAVKSATLKSGYISTDDTISAFIWQSVLRGRSPRLTQDRLVRFCRAVDVRRYLNISSRYPGMMQHMTYHSFPLSDLKKESLGAIASNLREAVDPKTCDLAYNTKAYATMLSRTPDKTKYSLTAKVDTTADLMLSSWAKINCYEQDFGLGLGMPAAVRRPAFIPVESLLYLCPKRADGEIAAGLCLRDDDLERLKADEEFGKYARYIG